MAFVLHDDAFGANINLVVLAEELGSLIWMFQAVLLCGLRLLFQLLLLLLSADMALTVEIVQYGEVLDQLLDVWAEITPARRAGQYVTRPEIHEAMLAEGMAAGEDAGDFLFVIILIKADRTSYFHPVIVAS